jgi:hypothetical protein
MVANHPKQVLEAGEARDPSRLRPIVSIESDNPAAGAEVISIGLYRSLGCLKFGL